MANSIREALESAVSEVEARESGITAAPEPVERVEQVQPAETETPIGEPAPEAKAADRKRAEDGKFAAETPREKAIRLGTIKPAGTVTAAPAVVPVVPVVPKIPRPDSWKKEMSEAWDKFDPKTAAYIKEREDQYFKGVSTYKQEWENAKPLLDAIAPFLPTLQAHGIKPDTWITNLGRAHHALATGDGQSKLQMFAKLAQDYGVPLQALYDQQAAQQFVQQTVQRPAPQAQPQQDLNSVVQKALDERDAKQKFAEFSADIETKYPHYETVKPDMALLLEAGKAKDYPSAYSMALRLHDDLFAASQAEKQKADEATRLEAVRKAVATAKGNAVSVKSATPAGAGAKTPTTRREALEAAYDQHASGRV
jgi:hypothetical protein